MSFFARHKGRHVRRHSSNGWAGLARVYADAAAHPVIDLRIACPALFRADDTQPINFKDFR